jgi:hypothetical protein
LGPKKRAKQKKGAKTKRDKTGKRKGATKGSFLPQFGTDDEHAARGALRSLVRLADVLQFARDGKKKRAFFDAGGSFFLFACSASLVTTPSFKWSIFLRTSIHSNRDSVIAFFGKKVLFLDSRTEAKRAF